ncbi:MAG: phospholipid carrier-dependent glycosyltransferase [Christensenellaceae bacterium]
MKKRLGFVCICILILSLLLAGVAVAEEEVAVFDDYKIAYDGELPDGYGVDTSRGSFRWDMEKGVILSVEEEAGYTLFSRQVTLDPDTLYAFTATLTAEHVSDAALVQMFLKGQLAKATMETGLAGETTLFFYAKTNKDAAQTYIICMGLGDETALGTGTVQLSSLQVKEVAEPVEDHIIFPLVGTLAAQETFAAEYNSQPVTIRKNRIEHDRTTISYDHIGEALMALLLLVALYLMITGQGARRLARLFSGPVALYLLFAGAFFLRFYLAWTSTGDPETLTSYARYAVSAYENGLSGFYIGERVQNCMPILSLVSWMGGALRSLLGYGVNAAGFLAFLRLPGMIADIALMYLIYHICKKRLNKGTATLFAAIAGYMPLLWWNSAMTGVYTSIPVFFSVLALYWLSEKKFWQSGIVTALAILSAIECVLLLPIILLVYLNIFLQKEERKKGLWQLATMLLTMFTTYLVVLLPLKGTQSWLFALQKPIAAGIQQLQISFEAFNLLSLFGEAGSGSIEAFLQNNFRIFALVGLGLGFLFVLILSIWKKERKYLFLYAALFFTAAYTFCANMPPAFTLFIAVFLYMAAMDLDSRNLFFGATLFSGVGFLNIYINYAFGLQTIYTELILFLSILEILAAIYVFYAAYEIFFLKKIGRAISVAPLEEADFSARALAAAGERIAAPSEKQKWMVKKDYLLLALVTVIYAIFAFTNLGSITIPSEGQELEARRSEIILTIEDENYVETLKYYTGYCEGNFSVYYSRDGETYMPVEVGTVEHFYRFMFRWEQVKIKDYVKYIKIVPVKGMLAFREMGIFDLENKQLALKEAEIFVDGVPQDGGFLIDEQEQVPETTDHMTEMYFDEIYHARTAYEYIEGIYPYEITHPPLGKSLITIGIRLFGMNPFGWRFMGTLFGVLMLPVLYLFAKKLFGRTRYALGATILFAADFMHFSLTRIATIDSYSIFFILCMYLFMYLFTERNFLKEPLRKSLLPLALSGVFFALGAATKWICIYAGGGLAIIFFHTLYKRYQEYRYAKAEEMEALTINYKKKLIQLLLFCVVVFIIVPIIVYSLSYIPYFNTREGFGIKGILDNQKYMLGYHGNLGTERLHSYQSNAYTWPFTIRPVFFFRADDPAEGMAGVLWNMGNPLIWIGGLALVLYLIGMRKKEKNPGMWKGISFIAIAALMGYIPWMLVNREIFIYHYFAVVPFLILASVYALRFLEKQYAWGKYVFYGFIGASVLLFFLFYPANTGLVVSRTWLNMIQWFPTWPI